MSDELIKHGLSVVGTTLQITRAMPSALRVIRTRRIDAGGALGVDLLLISGLWWVVYAFEIGNLPTFVSSLVGLAAPIAALWVLGRSGQLRPRAIALVVIGIALIPVAIESSRDAAVVAAVLGAMIGVPSAIGVLLSPDAIDDVPIGTWILVGVNATVWIAYGILISHPILGAAGILQLPCCMLIYARALRRRSDAGPVT